MEKIEFFKIKEIDDFCDDLKNYEQVLGLEDFFSLEDKSRDEVIKLVNDRLYSPGMMSIIEKEFSKEWATSKYYKRNERYCIKSRYNLANRKKPVSKVISSKITFEMLNNKIVICVDSIKTQHDCDEVESNSTETETNIMIDHAKIVASKVEEKLFIKTFIKDFYDVLHEKDLTEATGSEAIWMREIYLNAKEHFPDFGELKRGDQYNILKEGYIYGRRNGSDIYKLSKYTFFEMEKKGLISKIVRYDPIFDRNVKYYVDKKSNDHEMDSKDIEDSHNVCEHDSLICVQYVYETESGVKFKASFHCSELWNLLHFQKKERRVGI